MVKSNLLNPRDGEVTIGKSYTGYSDIRDEKVLAQEKLEKEIQGRKVKKGKLNDEDFTTLRLPKTELQKLRILCTILGEPTTFAHKLVPMMVKDYSESVLTSDQLKLFKLMLKANDIKL